MKIELKNEISKIKVGDFIVDKDGNVHMICFNDTEEGMQDEEGMYFEKHIRYFFTVSLDGERTSYYYNDIESLLKVYKNYSRIISKENMKIVEL